MDEYQFQVVRAHDIQTTIWADELKEERLVIVDDNMIATRHENGFNFWWMTDSNLDKERNLLHRLGRVTANVPIISLYAKVAYDYWKENK